MCDRYTYVQRQYVKIYRETEQRIFEEMAKVYNIGAQLTLEWSVNPKLPSFKSFQDLFRKIPEISETLVEGLKFQEMASSVATDNSRAFFTKPNLLKEDWDALSSLPSLEDPFMFPRHWLLRNRRMELLGDHNAGNGNLDNYTTLQRWRKTKVHSEI